MGTPTYRERFAAAEASIKALAELSPTLFVAEPWKPHRPLKRGIHHDLVTRGILRPEECRPLFRHLTARLQYQRCLAAGGPRYGLDGELCGEVAEGEVAGDAPRSSRRCGPSARRRKVAKSEAPPGAQTPAPAVMAAAPAIPAVELRPEKGS